ncbi:hypothetical protein [Dysgonomonas termitidis]|uniref:DUF4595 domain-containing protein n=1 Tax=Dysgonomonas termitidis TaxID=1516126 RepID=A0ABV9KWK7_9BACT
MKKQNFIVTLLFVCIFSACSNDDDIITEPEKKTTLITKLERLIDDQKVPFSTFAYDNNNQLTEIVYKEYDTDSKNFYKTSTYKFTRNGKTARVNLTDVYHNDNDRQETDTYDFKYDDNGNVIEWVVYALDGITKEEIYTITWNNGNLTKLTKLWVEENENETYDVIYDANGNIQPVTVESFHQGIPSYTTYKSVYTFSVNTSKNVNFFSLLPQECILLTIEAEYLILSRNRNEVITYTIDSQSKTYTSSDKTTVEREFTSKETFAYAFKYDSNGLPTEVIESSTEFVKHIDHVYPENNWEHTYGPSLQDAIYPIFIQK